MVRLASLVFPLLVFTAACAGNEGTTPTGEGGATTSPPAAEVTTPAEPECADLTGEPTAQIVMRDNSFVPFCAIVSGEQGLEFVNEGKNRHSFTVPKLDMDVRAGETKTTEPVGQVLKAGETHAYVCKYHGGMNGELRVE
jgi:plastocyanin